MEYAPILLGLVALLVAGFTFYRMGSVFSRLRNLEKRNRKVEEELKMLKEEGRKNSRSAGQENSRPNRNPAPQASQGAPRTQAPQSPGARQAKPQAQQTRGPQGEPRQNGNQGQTQRPPQEPRQRQDQQPPQQRQPKEQRPPQEPRQRQNPTSAPQEQGIGKGAPQSVRNQGQAPQDNPRRNENRKKEQMNPRTESEMGGTQERPAPKPTLGNEMVGDHLLSELTQTPEPAQQGSRIHFAVIPEDGLIKNHQLQTIPDSDSYLEIDAPAEGSSQTRYRFNTMGNQAFVISQGMDRLESAFSFEKPTNRSVSQIVLQGDGVLTKTGNGWKIQEKAKIDFR